MRQLMEDGAQIKGGPAGETRQGLDKFPLIYESPPNIMTQLRCANEGPLPELRGNSRPDYEANFGQIRTQA